MTHVNKNKILKNFDYKKLEQKIGDIINEQKIKYEDNKI